MNFQRTNNIVGWITFGIALITYWLTFEETASYWDVGEFIAVAYKLEVPHPPGAPLFLLLGRLFSFLALGDVYKVAFWINFMSVLSAAFTILFLFWSITLFGRKMVKIDKSDSSTSPMTLLLMGAGFIGALAYTFSDSFWFSAVEAEVYAMSSFFTAFVVWGILKWDVIEDESKANRWLILIAYMMGLSIGVHMLNLVTIPALGLIYYFKKYKPSRWGIAGALVLSFAIIIFINDFIVPGLPTLAGNFEVFFVNTLGLPFGSGVIVFSLIIIGSLVFGIRHSQINNKPLLNTFLLSTTFILIGYCSYATIVIRSNFNPPINENAPRDVMSFVSYLKREQYGSRPLMFGPTFTSQPIDIKYGAPVYRKGKDKYEIADRKFEYVYDYETFFPRAWSSDYADSYKNIIGLKEGQRPSFTQNIYFMFKHQIGYMFMRYFMWNYAGRESDEQGADWLGPNGWFEKVPTALAENGGRNNFFMIPFVLGLIGMFFQFSRDTKNFAVVGLLFVMLGVAIVVYLNSPPVEPRERDYIYAGSTYAFAFWIGFSVIAIGETLGRYIKNLRAAAIAAILIGASAPIIMAAEGWDDHNRSNRFFSVDSGRNYLASCTDDAILYTGGDNDTFMLWYAQEVEGFRTDMRVIVLSYFNTDWYIEQSMRKMNDSEPLKYTLSLNDYRQGGPNDYLPFMDLKLNSIDLKQYLDLLSKNHPQLRSDDRNIVPSKILTLNVDKAKVLASGIIPEGMDSLVVDQMQLRLIGGGLEKKDLAMLDMLATNDWERPIYVNHTSLSQFKVDLSPYAIQEGNTSRILPMRNPNPRKEFVNADLSYDNLINKCSYRGLDDPTIYYSEDYRNFVLNHRSAFNSVAQALIDKGDLEKARKALLFSIEKMADVAVPYDHTAAETVNLLFQVGEKEKALEIANIIGERADEMAAYLIRKGVGLTIELRKNIYIIGELQSTLLENGESELATKFEEMYDRHVRDLQINDTVPQDY
ncbi:MAG TPA: DUF2723 domain-containing protein [Cyclobacteriaceae bacterium]|nr:DUF2723 domain-containing protein [Cyclobacteriaceae bacterium]